MRGNYMQLQAFLCPQWLPMKWQYWPMKQQWFVFCLKTGKQHFWVKEGYSQWELYPHCVGGGAISIDMFLTEINGNGFGSIALNTVLNDPIEVFKMTFEPFWISSFYYTPQLLMVYELLWFGLQFSGWKGAQVFRALESSVWSWKEKRNDCTLPHWKLWLSHIIFSSCTQYTQMHLKQFLKYKLFISHFSISFYEISLQTFMTNETEIQAR